MAREAVGETHGGDFDPCSWERGRVRACDLATIADMASVLELRAMLMVEEDAGAATAEQLAWAVEEWERLTAETLERWRFRYWSAYHCGCDSPNEWAAAE